MRPEQAAQAAAAMKARLKVEELAENIDELEEVVEDVFPILLLTFLICTVLLAVFFVRLWLRWCTTNPSQNRMDGKTVLITGGTSGIGKSTAIELARRKARVLITGRDRTKVEAVARMIRKKTGNPYVNGHVLDLGNLRHVKEFADEINANEKYIHILVNNAAYMGPMQKTDDGLERNFGVNYLGHFYLTNLLSEKMKKNAPSRIVNVTSDAYRLGHLDLEDLALNKGYHPYKAYGRSKLAQLLFNSECHKRWSQYCVLSFAVHPGATATELLKNYPGTMGSIYRFISRVMFKSPEEGSQTVVYCCVGDGLKDFAGKLFANCQVTNTSSIVRSNQQLARSMWKASSELCGMEPDKQCLEEQVEAVVAPGGTTEKVEDKKEL